MAVWFGVRPPTAVPANSKSGAYNGWSSDAFKILARAHCFRPGMSYPSSSERASRISTQCSGRICRYTSYMLGIFDCANTIQRRVPRLEARAWDNVSEMSKKMWLHDGCVKNLLNAAWGPVSSATLTYQPWLKAATINRVWKCESMLSGLSPSRSARDGLHLQLNQ